MTALARIFPSNGSSSGLSRLACTPNDNSGPLVVDPPLLPISNLAFLSYCSIRLRHAGKFHNFEVHRRAFCHGKNSCCGISLQSDRIVNLNHLKNLLDNSARMSLATRMIVSHSRITFAGVFATLFCPASAGLCLYSLYEGSKNHTWAISRHRSSRRVYLRRVLSLLGTAAVSFRPPNGSHNDDWDQREKIDRSLASLMPSFEPMSPIGRLWVVVNLSASQLPR